MREIKIGDTIKEHNKVYRIVGGEGKTGMGIIYICYNSFWKIPVALKTYQRRFIFSQEIKEAFTREALAWVNLKVHPFIVRAITLIEYMDHLFIALEYIPRDNLGRNTLTHYLRFSISLEQILTWGIQFCYGMEHAKSHGISTHRDIKPDNIMIIPQKKTLKITDFGLAKSLDDVNRSLSNETESINYSNRLSVLRSSEDKLIAGTPPWMAPEQFEGYADVRSDIYSFGIILFQMVNQGKLPFVCSNIKDFSIAHKNQPLPKFESELALIIKKCLQKSPKNRYQDFKELKLDLEQSYKKNIGENIPLVPKEEINEADECALRGYSYDQLQLFDMAIQEYENALKLNDEIDSVYTNLGIAYRSKGLYDKSIKVLQAGIKKFPKNAYQHINLATAYQIKGLNDKARKEIKRAIKLEPKNAEITHHAGYIYADMNDTPEAIKYMKRSIELDPNSAFYYEQLGVLLFEAKSPESIKMFQKAIEINPTSHKSYFYIGLLLGGQGRLNEALIFAKQALALDPNDAGYHTLLGNVFQHLGSFKLALKEYKEALSLEPKKEESKIYLEERIKYLEAMIK